MECFVIFGITIKSTTRLTLLQRERIFVFPNLWVWSMGIPYCYVNINLQYADDVIL